jgi:hypothetical protein
MIYRLNLDPCSVSPSPLATAQDGQEKREAGVGESRPALARAGRRWREQAGAGKSRRALARAGGRWQEQAGAGKSRRALARAGRRWWEQAGAGGSRSALARAGRRWREQGRCWQERAGKSSAGESSAGKSSAGKSSAGENSHWAAAGPRGRWLVPKSQLPPLFWPIDDHPRFEGSAGHRMRSRVRASSGPRGPLVLRFPPLVLRFLGRRWQRTKPREPPRAAE